jgi:hypothetical protein
MRTAANTTDADRARLARRVGRFMHGPEEWQRCPDHPRKWESYRWVWEAGSGPEDATAEMVRSCDHPDHEREDD